MYSAPSVSYPVGRFVWGVIAAGLSCSLLFAICVFFALRQPTPTVWIVALSLAAAVSAWGLSRQWRHAQSGQLAWHAPVEQSEDGLWSWCPNGYNGVKVEPYCVELTLILPLQYTMFVALESPLMARRLVRLSARAMPERWQALRQAVWYQEQQPTRGELAAPRSRH